MKHPLILTALLLAPLAALHAAEPSPALQPPAASVTVSDLRCGGQVEPLGIDDEELLLGWQIKGDTRGLRQTANQFKVTIQGDRQIIVNPLALRA